MIFRKLAAIVAVICLAGSMSLPAGAAQISDEMYSVGSEPGFGYLGYSAYPNGAAINANSGRSASGHFAKSVLLIIKSAFTIFIKSTRKIRNAPLPLPLPCKYYPIRHPKTAKNSR